MLVRGCRGASLYTGCGLEERASTHSRSSPPRKPSTTSRHASSPLWRATPCRPNRRCPISTSTLDMLALNSAFWMEVLLDCAGGTAPDEGGMSDDAFDPIEDGILDCFALTHARCTSIGLGRQFVVISHGSYISRIARCMLPSP